MEVDRLPNPHDAASRRMFATTHWSLVLNATGQGPASDQALESLCRSYWPAIHCYVRRRVHDPEQARDLTQEFFARLLQRGAIAAADPGKGRFRTFLLTALQRFLSDELARAVALKRGGGDRLLSLEELASEEGRSFEPSTSRTPEQEFDRRWALATLDNALLQLRAEAEKAGNGDLFRALQGLLAGGGDHGELTQTATQLGLGDSAIKMRLSRWRARYRELIREEIAQTVPRLADLDEEMRHLLQALEN